MSVDLNSLAGALIVSSYLNWGLLGVLLIQVYIYYLAFPEDRLFAKILVYTVLLIEVVQTVVVSYNVYAAIVPFFGTSGQGSALDSIQQNWLSIPVVGGLTGGIGQFFFAYRLWAQTSNGPRGAPIIIGILATASVVSSLVSAENFFRAGKFSTLIGPDTGSLLAAIGVWNGVGAVCDITIALTMPYYLMRHGTGLMDTHVRIVNLVRLIIETGILTAIVAILHLCLYFVSTPAFLVPGLTISKVYANTILVILNNRMRIVGGRVRHTAEDGEELPSPGGQRRSRQSNGGYDGGNIFKNTGTGRSTTRIIVSKERLTFRSDGFEPRKMTLTASEKGQASISDISTGASILVPEEIYGQNVFDIPLAEIPNNTRL